MTNSRPFFSVALAAGFAAVLHFAGPARADTPPDVDASLTGSYLAARLAISERDNDAAITYLRNLLRLDSRNDEIVERTFYLMLVDGQIDEAMKLTDRLIKTDRTNRIARLALAVRAIRKGHYQSARTHLALSVAGPVGDLTKTLLAAWTLLGTGNAKGAVEHLDRLEGPAGSAPLKELHAGLILDAAGMKKEAGKRLEQAMKMDPGWSPAVDAYARWASRNEGIPAALAAYSSFAQLASSDVFAQQAIKDLKAGKSLPPRVKTPQEGAAEVLFDLGSQLGRQGGEDLGLLYLQFATWLQPDHPLASFSLADIYDRVRQPGKAITFYEAVPADSPLKREAEIRRAVNLAAIDKFVDGRASLEKLIAADPKDLGALRALAMIEMTHKMFGECAATFSRAITLVPQPSKADWPLFYFNGMCNERSKNWPVAEASLKRAIELSADQPEVLNYLGYSWVDQGMNLDQGLNLIRKAVKLRPDDGPTVDSLGWVYYKLGRYDEAVTELERAVELMPQDPVINDHLGDAYWKVGRKLEATFQWAHARDLKPDPDDLPKIVQKIEKGLDTAEQPAPPVRKAEDQTAAPAAATAAQ
ncbi:tetratricopeptide repeat protein [Xanthobacter dioxanivorans]|uniref:Tetratricopeptide repeat protein n=1 Tax=Xanthobacter dioxanivorans TaxID=2528964 RepID=A0A974PK80_9HYPH|nr:tetratricopeptide repeat protein [Xanthobacter dioxanivorans]QRG04729.1 tetratricopeptide repeat protein [Xanthobacter dioxanivorans]